MGPDPSVGCVKNLMGRGRKEVKNTQVRESRKRKSSLSLFLYIYIYIYNLY